MTPAGEGVEELTTRSPDGALIHVVDHPATGVPSGPTVVLAHGWCLSHLTWEPVARALQQRRPGTRVITYDQPGHGRSTPPTRPSSQIRDLGATLAAVVGDHAPGEDLVLGGHSMGGMSVMALAGLHPELVRERVRGALLVATAADLAGRRPVPGERLAMTLLAAAPARWPGLPTTPALTAAAIFGADPDPAAVRETARLTSSTAGRTTARYFRAMSTHDETAALAALTGVPTHVVTGARDRLTSVRRGRQIAAAIPGSTFWAVPGAGHMLTYEATDLLVDRLESLLDGAGRG